MYTTKKTRKKKCTIAIIRRGKTAAHILTLGYNGNNILVCEQKQRKILKDFLRQIGILA